MWVLLLNDMRTPKFEVLQPVVKAKTRWILEAFVRSETVPLWRDGKWAKSFRQGGPLEWCNRVGFDEDQHYVFVYDDSPGLVHLPECPTSPLMESQRRLQQQLRWLSEQDHTFPAPLWLGALVAAFIAMDVDDPEHDSLAALIDRVEQAHGVEGETFFDYVNDCGGES